LHKCSTGTKEFPIFRIFLKAEINEEKKRGAAEIFNIK